MFFQIFYNTNNNIVASIILFITVATALIFSLVMHELGHGYASLWCGDKTAQANGRLSLNPMKHLDPLGFLMLVFMGFGYAKPVPVNPYNFRNRKLGMFLVSIAGVSVNIVLAFLSSGLFVLFSNFNSSSLFILIVTNFFYYLMFANIMLCFFNLLPLYPLDGFRLLESLLGTNNKFVEFLRRYSMYFLIILIALGVICDRFTVNASWWQYVDLLGLYLRSIAGWIYSAFTWFWGLIF